MKVAIQDTRYMEGTFLAFDKHMNLVLGDTDEYRRLPNPKGGETIDKRVLGMILLRGEAVVSIEVVGPPRALQMGPKMPPRMLPAPMPMISSGRGLIPLQMGSGRGMVSLPRRA